MNKSEVKWYNIFSVATAVILLVISAVPIILSRGSGLLPGLFTASLAIVLLIVGVCMRNSIAKGIIITVMTLVFAYASVVGSVFISLHSGMARNAAAARTEDPSEWGSFHAYSDTSYDGRYTADVISDQGMIIVTITDTDGNEVFTFEPARRSDFWGICWANDSYDLWIQSGDTGTFCMSPEDGMWVRNDDAVRPDYIITRYELQNGD